MWLHRERLKAKCMVVRMEARRLRGTKEAGHPSPRRPEEEAQRHRRKASGRMRWVEFWSFSADVAAETFFPLLQAEATAQVARKAAEAAAVEAKSLGQPTQQQNRAAAMAAMAAVEEMNTIFQCTDVGP